MKKAVMYKVLLRAALWALAPGAAFAAEPVQTYAMVKEKSALKFMVIQGSEAVRGVFDRFTVDVAFDPDRLAESRIRAEVDVGSLRVDDAAMQAGLLAAEWLDAGKAPKAVFVSEEIDRIPSTNDYHAKGTLTLKGVSKPATLNFRQEFSDGKAVVITGFCTLQRNEFGVGTDDSSIKYAVRVEFRVHALKQ